MADEKTTDSIGEGRHATVELVVEDTSGLRNQHPALHGDPEGEVAKRSADGSSGMTFHKVFVLGSGITDDAEHPQHLANLAGTLQEAINRGLHPKGEPKLVSVNHGQPDRRGAVSSWCKYTVDVEPAVTDTKAHTTETPTSFLEKKDATSAGSGQSS